jgi:hypothetical protein
MTYERCSLCCLKSLPRLCDYPLTAVIDDMNLHRFSPEIQRNYIRDVGRFATFVGRPPDTATAEDLRRFQVEQPRPAFPCR